MTKKRKESAITALSIEVSGQLTDAYRGARINGRRISQGDLAKATGINSTMLQKKLAGTAPIYATDIAVIAAQIPGVTAGEILERAIAAFDDDVARMSVVPANNVIAFKKKTNTDYDEYTGDKAADDFNDEATEPDGDG